MNRKIVTKNTQGEELYPKTIAEQVVVYTQFGIETTQADKNKEIDYNINEVAKSELSVKQKSYSADIILNKGGYGPTTATIPAQDGSTPNAGLMDAETYRNVAEMYEESIPSLQTQINEIVAKNAVCSISASPNVIYRDVPTSISVTASIRGVDSADLTIKKDGTTLKTEYGVSYMTVKDTINKQTDYEVSADYKGVIITKAVRVNAEYPIYVGSGRDYKSVSVDKYKQNPRTSPRGDYSFTAAEGDNIFIIVPINMSINTQKGVVLTESGFGVPFENAEPQQINGHSYYVYKSSNLYKSGLIKITVK